MASEIVSYEMVDEAITALDYLKSEDYSHPALEIGEYVWRTIATLTGEILEDEGIVVAVRVGTHDSEPGWQYRVAWQKAPSQSWRATPFLEWEKEELLNWYEIENQSRKILPLSRWTNLIVKMLRVNSKIVKLL